MLNAGGPPITSYLLLQPITPTVFMGTNTLFFAIINLLKLPGSLAAGVVEPSALAWSMAFCPLVAIGVFLGRYVIARIDAKVFDHIMTVVLVIRLRLAHRHCVLVGRVPDALSVDLQVDGQRRSGQSGSPALYPFLHAQLFELLDHDLAGVPVVGLLSMAPMRPSGPM